MVTSFNYIFSDKLLKNSIYCRFLKITMEACLTNNISISEVLLLPTMSSLSSTSVEKFDFQSTFAKSLAFNSEQSHSLLHCFRIGDGNQTSKSVSSNSSNEVTTTSSSSSSSSSLPTESATQLLWANSPTTISFMNSMNSSDAMTTNKLENLSKPHYRDVVNSDKSVELTFPQQNDSATSNNKPISAEIEVLRLRKECQSLIEDNRRLLKSKAEYELNQHLKGRDNNVEAVILQSQVDTLHWQLKHVESSRQMYHAVMEEIVRFLERCHQSLSVIQQQHKEQQPTTSRPRSLCNTFMLNTDISRVRTSTNSMDITNGSDQTEESIGSSSIGSYSNFSDFTWCRSPKKSQNIMSNENVDCDPGKLAQEAFRLLRTAQSLINLKEPVLSDSKQPTRYQLDVKTDSSTCSSTLQRKFPSLESSLSIQSCTNDSLHSTSSSRNETDEDIQQSDPFCSIPSSIIIKKNLIKSVTSSADDESGFSSMNSFQEIGLPNPAAASSLSDKSDDSAEDTTIVENEKSSVQYCDFSTNSIKPLTISHRRWSSTPPLPPKRNLPSFPGHSADESLKVLWV